MPVCATGHVILLPTAFPTLVTTFLRLSSLLASLCDFQLPYVTVSSLLASLRDFQLPYVTVSSLPASLRLSRRQTASLPSLQFPYALPVAKQLSYLVAGFPASASLTTFPTC